MLKNGDIQLNWSIKESFFLGVNIIYKSLHILIYFSDSVHRSLFCIFMGSFSIHFYVIFYQLVQPFAFSFTQPSYITQVREQILWKMTVVQCALCAWCLCVFVYVCLPQVSCDYFLYVKFILTVFWTSIAMWGFLKYLFWLPVYIYVRCVLVFLRNSMWDLSCFCVFVNLYSSVRFTLVFVWISRNMWCSS